MILIQDKNTRKTLLLSINSAFPDGEDLQWQFDNNISRLYPTLTINDLLVYRLNDVNDASEIGAIARSGKREIQTDGQGAVIGCQTWDRISVSITGLMQLTVSNGGINDEEINLALADRQINVTADPVYDKTFELHIIKNDSTGAVDWAWCENGAALPSGWSSVKMLLSGTIPVGTTDLSTLGLI